jgi:ferrous iron transport protein B
MDKTEITIALIGNPNSGKTTVFNNLTGARQHVGNWPGVTVEKKEGICQIQKYACKVVDLPGVYSLTAYSPDEVIARDFILNEKPDVVVDIVDASNLERNLYLTLQIMEIEVPLIIALNMMDEAESKGYKIDTEAMSRETGVPVVPMVANRNKGTDKLLDAISGIAGKEINVHTVKIEYGNEVEKEISELEKSIAQSDMAQKYSPRWLAIKLLEDDTEIVKLFEEVKSA